MFNEAERRHQGGMWDPNCLQHTDIRSFADLCRFLAPNVPQGVKILETGTTFHTEPEGYDTYSTPNLVKWIAKPRNGSLTTLDHEPNIPALHEVFEGMGILTYLHPVGFEVGDSIDSIGRLNQRFGRVWDIIHLDSAEDNGSHMLLEYMAIADHLPDKHYVLVDDVHNPASSKWRMLVPWLKNKGCYDTMALPTGMGTFLAARGLPLPRVNR
jgi:hypothetical protein